ncbi:flagellar basal body P-ring formation chaperone FlgA [Roseinatronobacter alkalisoli]|uniref:Flagella basal body P-ring formation protein FlgA n=1 Tax=Roseinatronobacter alkalisoli TaxID=3028235 RepID=A0ABT5T7I2_9RHOB|nr:flagellar basal body P-ring formation chaperone FlgA [Roseinatronobacter sp. HJB301]MDD7970157.1 flagellar basal body P-ring formation chaperone FlgA [Roseinatronobacter sp. HJB301]
MRNVLILLLALLPQIAAAQSLVATRLIRATEIIGPGDIAIHDTAIPGAAASVDQVIGLETRVAIYPGRPVRLSELGPAAVVERNDVVQILYRSGALTILTEGRALARGAIGDQVSVMNLASRQSVQGTIMHAGFVEVSAQRRPLR